MKFRINLCVTYTVEADNEDEAIEEAYRQLEEELESPHQSVYDIFAAHVNLVE